MIELLAGYAPVNREYFVLKLFLDSLAYPKIKLTKILYYVEYYIAV